MFPTIQENFTILLRAGAFGITDEPLKPMSSFKWNKLVATAKKLGIHGYIVAGAQLLKDDPRLPSDINIPTPKDRGLEILYDVDRIDGCKTACYQKLSTVGEKSLCGAREGVEDGCSTLRLNTETGGYIFGDATHGDYCHGVVGSTYIDQRNEDSD